MTEYKYVGRAYRQALTEDAPWLVSFVAPADELSLWAGVPRRSEQNRAGFQRLEDQARVERAKEYFQQPVNQSPTSLILGLHGELSPNIAAKLTIMEQDEEAAASRPCMLTVSYQQPNLQEARDIVSAQLRQRLNEGASVGSGEDPAAIVSNDDELVSATETDEFLDNEASADEETGEDLLEDEESIDDEELELGQSVLSELLLNMQDDNWLLDESNAAAVIDLAKPATIIDGQHRLLGADATERGIPFSVVALDNCPWSEQVFQFTVVNYTAQGIPDQFITANAALSLTKTELDQLKTRLVQANVKIKEYDLMRIVNFDARSPFTSKINLTERPAKELIGYKTMVQVAAQWFDARHQVFNTLLPRLYPEVKGKGQKTKRAERWREGDWGEFFLAFWQEVQRTFGDEPSHEAGRKLWDVGHSQLMVAVVLLEMQKAFLDNLNAQDEDFFDFDSGNAVDVLTEKVRIRAKKFVNFLPASFFSTPWGITSLNTGSGRKDLQTCIRQLVDSKGKYQFSQDRLVTGG